MPTTREIFWGVVMPALIAVIVMFLSHLPGRRGAITRPWGPALALAGAFAAAFVGISGNPRFPPVDAKAWLIYAAWAGVVVALGAAVAPRGGRRAWTIASIAIIPLAVFLLLRPRAAAFEPGAFRAAIAGISVAFIAWWASMEWLAHRLRGPGLPLLLALWAGASALVLINARSLLLGQLVGASAVVLGVIAVMALWFRELSLARGAVLVITIVVLSVILAGHHHAYAELSTRDFVLLAAAPLLIGGGEISALRRQRATRFAMQVIAMLAVLAIPLVPALKGLRQTMQEQTNSYSY